MTSPQVSVVIKALNEGRNIGRTLDSIHAACQGLTVEVILADSLSTDDTVAIALDKGAKVVQLCSPDDRCCGVGAQLGFQVSSGEFVFIVDGDMEIVSGFIERAIEVLHARPDVAGVAGQVQEMTTENRVFVTRRQHNSALTAVGEVDRLDMGGLYRAAALRQAGYFTHRGLHSCEERELGCRLVSHGWRLLRLEHPSVRHWGHTMPRYALLRRRVQSSYFLGPGEFLRASWGRPWFGTALKAHKAYLTMLAVWLLALLGLLSLPWTSLPLIGAGVVTVALLGAAIVKRRSLSDGLYSFVAWQVYAAGLLRGCLRTPTDPLRTIDHNVLSRSV